MAVGDLCYKSGGSLAYSKVDGESLIYKGTWTLTIDWTGDFDNGHAFSAGTASYTGTPITSKAWDFELDGGVYRYKLWWSDAELWVRAGIVWTSEPSGYPQAGDWYVPANSIVFVRAPWSSYGGGFNIVSFSNSSSDPEAAYSVEDSNGDYTCDVANVTLTIGWT
jgi:hypothetical protein